MQTFGLPGRVTSGAALASRLCGAEYSEAARRRDAFRHWRGAPNGCPPWSRRSSGCARTIRCGARPRAARRVTPDACPRAASPGEIVPLDTLSLYPGRPPGSLPTTPSQSGHAPRHGAAPPHARRFLDKLQCPSLSKLSRSMEAPSSRPTSMPALRHRAAPTPLAQAQRTRRAQQRRLAIRVLCHMGPARRRPRRHQPIGLRTPSDHTRPLADILLSSTSRS